MGLVHITSSGPLLESPPRLQAFSVILAFRLCIHHNLWKSELTQRQKLSQRIHCLLGLNSYFYRLSRESFLLKFARDTQQA